LRSAVRHCFRKSNNAPVDWTRRKLAGARAGLLRGPVALRGAGRRRNRLAPLLFLLGSLRKRLDDGLIKPRRPVAANVAHIAARPLGRLPEMIADLQVAAAGALGEAAHGVVALPGALFSCGSCNWSMK
jgi:hypothetical protein